MLWHILKASKNEKKKTNKTDWILEQNSTLHFHSLQDSKCLSVFKQIAFMERWGGFCLQVAEALVNEQEACHTGAVLLCLSERINLCLSLPTLRASTASRVPQSTGCTSEQPSAGLHPPCILFTRCLVVMRLLPLFKKRLRMNFWCDILVSLCNGTTEMLSDSFVFHYVIDHNEAHEVAWADLQRW